MLDEAALQIIGNFRVIFFPQYGFLICVEDSAFFLNEMDKVGRLSSTTQESFSSVQSSAKQGPTQLDFSVQAQRKRWVEQIAVEMGRLAGGWEFVFSLKNALFYRNSLTCTLDQEVGDLRSQIIDTEEAIFREVKQEVLLVSEDLAHITNLTAEVDALFSMYLAAREMGLVKPVLLKKSAKILEIIEGRHLLTEMVRGRDYVTNSLNLNQNGSIAVVTGPNNAGKSVFIKQVAQIVFLAHIGAYVPAQAARLSVMDKLLVKVEIEQSMISLMSYFQEDLLRAARFIQKATPHSLVILDQFARGTDQLDRVACTGALLHSFAQHGPFVLLTTHAQEVLSYRAFLPDNLVPLQMEVVFPEEDDEETQIAYLYKLKEGVNMRSNALKLFQKAGERRVLVKRAENIDREMDDGATKSYSRMGHFGRLDALERASMTQELREAVQRGINEN